MNTDKNEDKPQSALIKEHLRRSFQDKASEELPSDLMSLIDELRKQDSQDGK